MNPSNLLFGTSDSVSRIIKENSKNNVQNKYEDDRLKLEGSCTYMQFINYIDKIIKLINENNDEKIYFTSNNGDINPQNTKIPSILYSINSREPEEIRPRIRQTVQDKNNKNNYLNIYGQRFRYYIDFNIVSDTYDGAERIMEMFEDIMATYSGFFMSKGVADIRFVKQTSDKIISTPEKYFIKTLTYSIVLERITIASIDAIENIIANIQNV